MKAVLQATGILALLAQQASSIKPLSAPKAASRAPVELPEKRPVLLGEATTEAILANRAAFRDHLAKVHLSTALKARWQAVRQPFTLVAVFGSWCGDSHRQLPDLLALGADPNPFIEIHYLGVNRDKLLPEGAWPPGCAAQKVVRVPTFFLFKVGPGGRQKLVGSVVETPPRVPQTMAEALVELLEAAPRTPRH